MENIIVAVIGGSGFLGQHIVKELQLLQERQGKTKDSTDAKEDAALIDSESVPAGSINMVELTGSNLLHKKSIQEIRVLDIKPFKPVIEIAADPPVHYHECDIRLESKIFSELEGVSAVIHCAARIPSISTEETNEEKDLLWETNLEGTENVIWACRKADVKALVYTSTIAAVMGGEKIVLHSEHLTPVIPESRLILGAYGKSRLRAEQAVLEAHKTPTDAGGVLLTTALRPIFMYGEGDTRIIPTFIKIARNAGGKMPLLYVENLHQFSYVGNIAVAHVEALFHLLQGGAHPLRDCGGVPVYINDDSPTGSLVDILEPFMTRFGLQFERNNWSYLSVLLFYMVLGYWISFWEKIGSPSKLAHSYPPQKLQNLFATTTVVNRTRAELTLNYKPVYEWENAFKISLDYYKRFLGE